MIGEADERTCRRRDDTIPRPPRDHRAGRYSDHRPSFEEWDRRRTTRYMSQHDGDQTIGKVRENVVASSSNSSKRLRSGDGNDGGGASAPATKRVQHAGGGGTRITMELTR